MTGRKGRGYPESVTSAVYALSIHADYRCRHSGVCCSSDWDIPVELPLYRSLGAALATGRLQPAADPPEGASPFITGTDLPDQAAAMVARTASGHCNTSVTGRKLL